MENKVWFKTDSRNLVYGGTWAEAQSTIRAKVFGVMVELAKDRIKHYRSDLYHDAIWINEYLVGPMAFDWIARESGTHIGEVVLHIRDEDWPESVRYRFDIRVEENRRWVLDIYQSVPVTSLPTDIDYSENEAYQLQLEKECTGYTDNGSLQHDGDTCPVHEDLGAKYRDKMQEEWFETGEEFVLPDEFHPYFSNEPLPESVVESIANQDVNPINDMIAMLFAKPMASQEQSWADRHAALDISECEVALSVEGCIFHPAPVNGWTNEHVTVQENPTLRNESNTEPSAPIRKENKMDSIISDLREKYEEASNSKEQLEEYQSNINDAIDELESYLTELDDLISSLDQLPEVSVYVDLDTVSFDS